jgi:hypothetical protein
MHSCRDVLGMLPSCPRRPSSSVRRRCPCPGPSSGLQRRCPCRPSSVPPRRCPQPQSSAPRRRCERRPFTSLRQRCPCLQSGTLQRRCPCGRCSGNDLIKKLRRVAQSRSDTFEKHLTQMLQHSSAGIFGAPPQVTLLVGLA